MNKREFLEDALNGLQPIRTVIASRQGDGSYSVSNPLVPGPVRGQYREDVSEAEVMNLADTLPGWAKMILTDRETSRAAMADFKAGRTWQLRRYRGRAYTIHPDNG